MANIRYVIYVFVFFATGCDAPMHNKESTKEFQQLHFAYELTDSPVLNYKIIIGPYREGFNEEFYKDAWQTYYSDSLGRVKIRSSDTKYDSLDSKLNIYFFDSLSLLDMPQVFTLSRNFTDTLLKVRPICLLYFKCGEALSKSGIDTVRINTTRTASDSAWESEQKILTRNMVPRSFMKDSIFNIELVRPGETLEAIIYFGNKNIYREKYNFKLGGKYIKYL